MVIRWFEGPGYLTVHALGTAEEADVSAADAWLPLEWPNNRREITRVDTIFEDQTLSAAAAALAAELDDASWPWETQPPEPLVQAAARVRQLLADAGVDVAAHFAVGVCHFEGWGLEESVPRANLKPTLELLREQGIEPGESHDDPHAPRKRPRWLAGARKRQRT